MRKFRWHSNRLFKIFDRVTVSVTGTVIDQDAKSLIVQLDDERIYPTVSQRVKLWKNYISKGWLTIQNQTQRDK